MSQSVSQSDKLLLRTLPQLPEQNRLSTTIFYNGGVHTVGLEEGSRGHQNPHF